MGADFSQSMIRLSPHLDTGVHDEGAGSVPGRASEDNFLLRLFFGGGAEAPLLSSELPELSTAACFFRLLLPAAAVETATVLRISGSRGALHAGDLRRKG